MSSDRWDVAYDPSEGFGETAITGVRWLIGVNIAVYFLQLVVFGSSNVVGALGLNSATFPQDWWTAVTYMFVHGGLMHVGLNMFMLWMFGPRLEASLGTRSFLYFYLWCGIGGAVFHLLFAGEGMVVGASGAVVGVVLAYALRWPNDELYIFGIVPMKARWLAIWMIAWNVAMALAEVTGVSSGNIAWTTHVGGLVFAWLFINAPGSSDGLARIKSRIGSVQDEVDLPRIPRRRRSDYLKGDSFGDGNERGRDRDGLHLYSDDPEEDESHLSPADKAVRKSTGAPDGKNKKFGSPLRPISSSGSSKASSSSDSSGNFRGEEIDALLDKISRHGMTSLTKQERELLEDVSKRMRGRDD